MSDALNPGWHDLAAAADVATRVMKTFPTGFQDGSPEEEEYSRILDRHTDAVMRMVAAPAPDIQAVRQKLNHLLEFGMVEQSELRAIAADVERLASAEFDPARWLTDFEAAGGGFVIRDGAVAFILPTVGEIGTVQQLINSLDHCPDNRAAVTDRLRASDRNPTTDEGGN